MWPHCGPTNARLRLHLPLVAPILTRCLKLAPPPQLIPRLEQLCHPEQSPRLLRLSAVSLRAAGGELTY